MRKVSILIVLTIIGYNSALAQKTVEDIIKKELEQLLENGDILNTDDENKELEEVSGWFKKKTSKLQLANDSRMRKKILSEYPYPIDGKTKQINPNLVFNAINMSYLGSYLIEDVNNVKTGSFPKNSNDPRLPWLLSNSQVGLTNPNRNNYNLFSNLTYLVSLDAEMGLGVDDNPYFDNKAKTAVFKSQQNNQTLSVAYGTFNNQMASLFNRAKLKGQFNELEISPLLHLWLLYAGNQISGNEYVINSFEGLSIYRTSKVALTSSTDFSNETNVNITSIPFLKLTGNSNYNWSKSRKSTISENSYSIYMTSTPTYEKVPSVEEIFEIWNTFEVPNTIYLEGASSLQITNNNEQNTIKVLFGPISSEFKNRVQIDKADLLNQMDNDFIKDAKITEITQHPSKPGYYIYGIKFIRNDEFYESLSSVSPKLTNSVSMKLVCLDKISNHELSKSYNVILETETFPLPYVSKDFLSNLTTGTSQYKLKMRADIQSAKSVSAASIINIKLKNEKFKDFENALNQSDYQGNVQAPNDYQFTIEAPIDHGNFSPSTVLFAEITLKIIENGIGFERTINVRLPYTYPEELVASSNTTEPIVTIESANQLIDLLPDSTILSNNMTLAQFLEGAHDSTMIKSDAFELLKVSDKERIKFLESGYFQINTDILDTKKMK